MALQRWGFVYTLGADAQSRRRDEIGSTSCRLIAIGVAGVDDAASAARDLVAEGCELVEFCGAFGAREMATVLPALEASGVPIGVVTYGGDATAGLHRLFG